MMGLGIAGLVIMIVVIVTIVWLEVHKWSKGDLDVYSYKRNINFDKDLADSIRKTLNSCQQLLTRNPLIIFLNSARMLLK